MAFPTYTKTFHTTTYPSISPTRKELSTAGKVILITGGGSGIGSRIAHAFAASGSTSIAILGRTETSLISTKESIEAQHPGAKVMALVADIVDRTAVHAAFDEVKIILGPIDIVVSNAGHMPSGSSISTADVDEWFHGMEVNVKGNLILAQAFLANAAKKPVLINVSAAGVHIPALPVPLSAYVVSKAAVVKLVEYFAAENPGVRVMNVHPGAIDTGMAKRAKDAGLELPFDDIELPASFMVWAASPEAEFLRNKYMWANWDVDELKAQKEELVSSPQLTIGLLGWP
ncbi:Uncharacterized protein BP5553_01935 [Venustampulla echinocandica]|uniref:Ketoreductase domain-containing protein n=1 Tax=Venustampulla echinocandica TaxID=2656787 RepID=A0A370U2E9_9HELO|nr:Uncharacterized protein BP5553_01935 [Venustampulla echinocandica]RDL41956.1 Uncharacterized protein BP5553_01935 [Venustampulla echinocandica]